jgi:hypothetical protein
MAVGTAAAIGAFVTLLREWRAAVLLCIAFVPYFIFHLLFQQLDTVRYALPIVLPVVWLAARSFAVAGRFASAIAAPFVAAALLVAVPGGVAYSREAHPAFRAIADAVQRARTQPPAAVFSHYAVRRPLQAADLGRLHVVEQPNTNGSAWSTTGARVEPRRCGSSLMLEEPISLSSTHRAEPMSSAIAGPSRTGVN